MFDIKHELSTYSSVIDPSCSKAVVYSYTDLLSFRETHPYVHAVNVLSDIWVARSL